MGSNPSLGYLTTNSTRTEIISTAKIMDIDLSPFPKENVTISDFKLIKGHMTKFSSEARVGRIISCYRVTDERSMQTIVTNFNADRLFYTRPGLTIRVAFFSFWILWALIPEEKKRSLTIENVVVANANFTTAPQDLPPKILFGGLVGKGSLIIKKLTVVCTSSELCNINERMEELNERGNVKFEQCKVKVILDFDLSLDMLMEELDIISSVEGVYVKIMIGDRILSERAMEKISSYLEDDYLKAEIPICEGIYNSPHEMFGTCYQDYNGTSNVKFHNIIADRILIGTLGYGHKPWNEVPWDDDYGVQLEIIDEKNFTNDTAPVYNSWYTSPWIIDYYTETFSFVTCQTAYCNGVIANGATSKAIKWLREKWEETWKDEYDNLVVLIPYGGQYMEDEMIQIHEATNEGIIIICAAGRMGGRVVFPAALGTVLSVGVSNSGPKGREVDIHVSKEKLTKNVLADKIPSPIDCGNAAARITGLLAHLLSRINSVLNSNLTDPCNKEMAGEIKKIPHYLHTCVIRELLVNEGNGSHHPQLGYGEGEDILLYLLTIDEDSLLQKLADVFFKDDQALRTNNQIIPTNTSNEDETRKKLFYNLDGSGISVAVLDRDIEADIKIGTFKTTFKSFKKSSRHGEQCATIVHAVSPNASILCANNVEDDLCLGFYDCIHQSPSIDIISYSITSPFFDYNMCTAVNEAVVAGKIIVFAAGNTGKRSHNTIGYPGRIGNIIVVGGRDPHYNRIGFSSVGREMDFLAEGETGDLSGTSYAAPVVAGYIALLLQFIKENMNTDEDRIRAWSKNSQDEYEWQDIPAFDAAHNVYAMRTLLNLLVPKPQDHSDTEGFGCLAFSTLFPYYAIPNGHQYTNNAAKRRIHNMLQYFYKHK